jgi:hypothetical protein
MGRNVSTTTPPHAHRVRRRAVLAMAAVFVGAASMGAGTAAAAAPVPCHSIGADKYECTFYVPGDGKSAGAPVKAADGNTVGFLHKGTNWVLCQQTGGRETSGAYFNSNWAWTLADNNKAGWVNAVYASGGDNDSPFGDVPPCNGTHGNPPGTTTTTTPPPNQQPPPLGFDPDPRGFDGKKATFIRLVTPLAKRTQADYGVPPAFTIAQAAMESSWGAKTFGAKNFFGIKCPIGPTAIAVGCTVIGTHENKPGGARYRINAPFRRYRTAYDSFRDQADLLRRKWPWAFALAGDPRAFAREVNGKRRAWATNADYVRSIIRIIDVNHLDRI